MTQSSKAVIPLLNALRQRIGASQELVVMHEGGYVWTAGFALRPGADLSRIIKVNSELSQPLPDSYQSFLSASDGALLYADTANGQWGVHLYGTTEITQLNARWSERYSGNWPSAYIAFAEFLGDGDLLLWDTRRVHAATDEPYVLDGDSGYPPDTWKKIAPSFSHWLDWFIVAQGAKFWRWRW